MARPYRGSRTVRPPRRSELAHHREDEQEDFLILQGKAVLLVEGEERPLRAWDLVHCPAWTEHVIVGAGDEPCTLLAIGTRLRNAVVYPVSELARRHGAGAERETRDPKEAYAHVAPDEPVPFRPEWLPGAA